MISFKEIKLLSQKNKKSKKLVIPLVKEILLDTETPISIFLKVASNENFAYLLESAETNLQWGRYSFMSFSPYIIFESKRYDIKVRIKDKLYNYKTDPFKKLRSILSEYNLIFKDTEIKDIPRFFGGFVGYIGYENVHIIEPSVSIPKKSEFVDIPDIWLMFNKNILVFDHYLNKLYIVSLLIFEEKGDLENLYTKTLEEIDRIEKTIKTTIPLPKELKIISNFNFGMKNYEANISKENFLKIIKKAKEYVYNGDVIQVVISRRLSKITEADPFDIYRCLRIINPSPYMFYLRFTNNLSLIGSSPEILVRKESNIVETRPIAGTRQRGTTEEEELKYEKALINSKKENAEHIMLVDLARNDLGRISKFSSVYLPQFRTIEKFSHVMHLVSSVKATLKEDVDSIDVLKACFPAGTVSGAPKVRAMQIISELENTTRGPYSGAVGYFSLTGDMDMAITIRTIVYFNKKLYIQTGAGIVSDSEPINEYNETLHKAKALLLAIAIAENSNIKK